MCAGSGGCLGRMLELLQLDLQVTVNSIAWLLGTKLVTWRQYVL